MNGTLYIVATPIGNLEDITLRALRVLKETGLILCEDTRVTKKLLSHFDITTPTERLDAHTEGRRAEEVANVFAKYETVALVTDAGTPTISDPGDRFVKAAHTHGITVVAVPGASALTAALSVSGLPASNFVFLGFLPHKKGREKLFREIADSKRVVVFYESPHRIIKALESLKRVLSDDRQIVVTRELTKLHEEVISGTCSSVLERFEKDSEKVRGEFVVLIEPA